jgi:REP element-mobilizing transposase RayT
MQLNAAGNVANECWLQIPTHFPNARLHTHVVMPNHVHGIIELMDVGVVGAENFLPLQPQHEFQKMIPRSIGSMVKGYKIGVTKWFRNNAQSMIGDDNVGVESVGVENFQPLPSTRQSNVGAENVGAENFLPLQPQTPHPPVGVENFQPQPIWQRNYHEHIIRNEQSYHTISDYIINNPSNWTEDKFHVE